MYNHSQLAKDVSDLKGVQIDYRVAQRLLRRLGCDLKEVKSAIEYDLLVQMLGRPEGSWYFVANLLRENLRMRETVSSKAISNILGDQS